MDKYTAGEIYRATGPYPQIYHTAIAALVHGNRFARKESRHFVASALVALRHKYGRKFAMCERQHMHFIGVPEKI